MSPARHGAGRSHRRAHGARDGRPPALCRPASGAGGGATPPTPPGVRQTQFARTSQEERCARSRPPHHRLCPLRPALRRLRPGAGADRGRVGKGLHGEVRSGNDDADFNARAMFIKEQRSDLVKEHLWVLWTDYFKPPHFEKYPQLHSCSTRRPSWPAPGAPRERTTSQSLTNCSPRSMRSPTSSGRPRLRRAGRAELGPWCSAGRLGATSESMGWPGRPSTRRSWPHREPMTSIRW